MLDTPVEFSIGQVAERTGLSVHTLRLYEREGLLTSRPRRSSAGRRVYSEWDVQWLDNCTKFRASGMPLAAIRRLAELVGEGPGNEAERLELLRAHRQRVLDRIAELHDCLDLISNKVGAYEEAVRQGNADRLWGTRSTGPDTAPAPDTHGRR
ncbi:MerR family transcriptional regulator [Plantactinospora sp. BB1]|uniref:MerR family transcriptional regulator n=1 Tax=Plantactinospora sp. BB1 TaxID=2071627 RepID=UPI000D152015|nr:MerR family transcriptional regulator [Plantactinospora sp. BB1]AVT41915.1 MerR family transcriptional regulator [Plantactinospora sp. BB1]